MIKLLATVPYVLTYNTSLGWVDKLGPLFLFVASCELTPNIYHNFSILSSTWNFSRCINHSHSPKLFVYIRHTYTFNSYVSRCFYTYFDICLVSFRESFMVFDDRNMTFHNFTYTFLSVLCVILMHTHLYNPLYPLRSNHPSYPYRTREREHIRFCAECTYKDIWPHRVLFEWNLNKVICSSKLIICACISLLDYLYSNNWKLKPENFVLSVELGNNHKF